MQAMNTHFCLKILQIFNGISYLSHQMEREAELLLINILISAAKYIKESKAVKDFILFYTRVQGQKLRLEKGEKTLPSLKYAVYLNTNDMVMPEHSNYIFYSLHEGFTEPNVLNYLQNKEKIFNKINQVWTGKIDLDNVLKVK